jgi:hypothetical protein
MQRKTVNTLLLVLAVLLLTIGAISWLVMGRHAP